VGALADLLNQLDADDRVKGKQFEHICKWFLTNDPVYKHELRRVWLWNEWPGRWGGDAGIDLVAEDRNGHLWAIQAKAGSLRRCYLRSVTADRSDDIDTSEVVFHLLSRNEFRSDLG
jgi:predicted helicase